MTKLAWLKVRSKPINSRMVNPVASFRRIKA
jgi:hypothetical protein